MKPTSHKTGKQEELKAIESSSLHVQGDLWQSIGAAQVLIGAAFAHQVVSHQVRPTEEMSGQRVAAS